ncbi:MBL fold hydrolase [Idiomarina tyrosinivorans]|uniref:MBL fold hydrolase n=1 Tax=Idiomarina tyrosinivorans TaxID=1445662 RepID=A0A432ZPC7_9GAMM|nr:MBL fold metallo-hydrolase [Idiomarina tyrosinivorans]RUO79759.1 MBL fold hydrolase [Idiomarina tyrosinivorans]
MKLKHWGGADTVTGSCHQLFIDANTSVLIDCGAYQGEQPQTETIIWGAVLRTLKAVFITHSHFDHIGRLPELLAKGFRGPIYCSQASAALLPIMLEDSLRQMTSEANVQQALLHQLTRQLHGLPEQQWLSLPQLTGVQVQLLPTGHILGAVAWQIITVANNDCWVFSGDVGQYDMPLLVDPVSPARADRLILESTYGGRNHESHATRVNRLKVAIERAVADGGSLLIPAFSLGRTQTLLYDLEQLYFQQRQQPDNSWHAVPVILDSPLAERVTACYAEQQGRWDSEAKQRLSQQRHPFTFAEIEHVTHHEQHLALVNFLRSTAAPCIVIAAGGMCEGGRIENYLKALLPDARTDVLLIGYQAHGTLGAQLQQGANAVTIQQQSIEVKAGINTLDGYSAHADHSQLLRYVREMPERPRSIQLVHGDAQAQQALKRALQEEFGCPVSTSFEVPADV